MRKNSGISRSVSSDTAAGGGGSSPGTMAAGGWTATGQFIAVPVKKTWEVDMARPLRAFIASTYDNITPEEYNYALNELNRLRVYYATKVNEKHESSLDVCFRYVDQLTAIEAKFPIAENQIRIAFKWQDAFGRRIQQLTSGAYERLCAIFNVGAVQSQVVDTLDITTDEGLKTAAKFFQQASGLFSHLQAMIPTVVLTGELTPDLWPDTLGALAALMLAQAQDCFVRKALTDQMKAAVVAKLAQQCASLYDDATKLMTSSDRVRNVWPREWVTGVAGRADMNRALAEYHQASVAKDAKNFGECIARLRVAKECATRAEKNGSGSAGGINASHVKCVTETLATAEKENGLIYNARVLDYKTLPLIEKATLAKQLPVNFPLMGTRFKDLFERIVPIPVQMALGAYENRKAEILQVEIGRLRAGTQALNGFLASLNLPAAIEDLSAGGSAIPQSLLVKAASVRRTGGIDHLNRITQDLPTLLQCNKELLDECDRMLNDEESSDRQLRAQFSSRGGGWTRTPSENLNAPIRAEAIRYRGIINNAVMADGKIRQRYAVHREMIALLSQTDTDIARALPGGGGGGAGLQGSPAVVALRRLMEQVQSLKEERDKLETQLKEVRSDMSSKFLTALAQDGAIYEEGLSVAELDRIYGPLKESVSQSMRRQDDLTEQIQKTNREFVESKMAGGGGTNLVNREQMLKQLAAGYDAFVELKNNIEEGARFYQDLTQMLVRFQSKVTDFCLARKTEKDEHLKDLTSGIASSSTGGGFGEVSLSPTGLGSYQLGGTRLSSSVNIINPGGGTSAVFGSKTTLPIGIRIGDGGGGGAYQCGGATPNEQFIAPMMPRGYNPYAQYSTPAATTSIQTTNQRGFTVVTNNQRR